MTPQPCDCLALSLRTVRGRAQAEEVTQDAYLDIWANSSQPTAMQQVLQAKDVQRFEKTVGTARATVVRSASLNKAVITVANLPGAPQGKVYELWLQQGNTMVKAGFIPKGTSNTVLLQGHAATANGAGITIEPAGGSTTPTLPPVALITFA